MKSYSDSESESACLIVSTDAAAFPIYKKMASKKMYPSQNLGCCTVLLLVIILLMTISNYFTFNKIQSHLQNPSGSRLEGIHVYEDVSLRDLRKKSLISAESERQALLNSSLGEDNKDFYSKVKMESFCAKKARIGETGDGGKFVCNPGNVKRDCTLLSLGLNNQIEYDVKIYDATGRQCTSLGADKDPQSEATQKKYSEMGGQLFAGKIPDELTIQSMLEKSGRKDVELLKIDIEGGEFNALEPLIKDYFVCQIFIEIHGKPAEHLKMMRIIAKYGFRLFSVEPNPYCVTCCEYSYINEMCMAQFEAIPLAITVPQ